MARRFLAVLLLLSTKLTAQEGVNVNPPVNPEPSWYESPTLWIVLAVGLLVVLLLLRKKSRPAAR